MLHAEEKDVNRSSGQTSRFLDDLILTTHWPIMVYQNGRINMNFIYFVFCCEVQECLCAIKPKKKRSDLYM